MTTDNERPTSLLAIGLALLGGIAVGAVIARREDNDDDEHPGNGEPGQRPGLPIFHEVAVRSNNGVLEVFPDQVQVHRPGFIVWTIDSSLPGYCFSETSAAPAIVFQTSDGNFTPPERVSKSDREVFVRDLFVTPGVYKYTVNLIDRSGHPQAIDPHIQNV